MQSVRDTTRRQLLLFGLLSICACGGTSRGSVPQLPGGSTSDSGPPPEQVFSDAGKPIDAGTVIIKPKSDAGTQAVDPLAPTVEFTAPGAASDANSDTVVTDASLVVSCKITRSISTSSSPINTSAIKITLETPSDATMIVAPPVIAGGDDGVYQATFNLSAFPNGALRFHCEARDLATTPHVGKTTLDTLLDLGPTLSFSKPKDMGTYALKTPLAISFQVKPSTLTADDNEADIQTVSLVISGVDTPVVESTTTPGLYQTMIDFSDRTMFPVPPTSAQLIATVTNGRTPVAATRKVILGVTLDGDGPKITVESPAYQSIVHGVVKLQLNVSDPSGLSNPNTLTAQIIGLTTITAWSGTAPEFYQTFDTRGDAQHVTTNLTQLTITISAQDSVGNVSTVTHQVRLDNLPPVVSLDPPLIREYRVSGANTFCSAPYDPVGSSAASDLQMVTGSSRFRALVEDRTNQPLGSDAVSYLAGVDTGSVFLYVQSDTSTPLLVDTDGDSQHYCDEINDLQLVKNPPTNRPTPLKLGAVNPTGSPWYKPNIDAMNPLSIAPSWCKADPNGSGTVPGLVCQVGFTEMYRVVPGRVQGVPPAVYADNPTNDSSHGECTGTSWELLTIAHKGWNCLAARALDTKGNIGVSAPLRVCFDDGMPPAPDCSMDNVPTCTDGCTIGDAQKFVANDVWFQQ